MITLLKKDFLAVWILATMALCIGLFLNQVRDKPFPLVYQSKEKRVLDAVERIASAEKIATIPPIETIPDYIDLEKLNALLESKKAIVIDARPEIFHRLGHIPGALSLPRDDFEESYAKHKDTLAKNKLEVLVVYCSSSSCGDSDLIRNALRVLGYERVTVFRGGWSEWTSAGLMEERNP